VEIVGQPAISLHYHDQSRPKSRVQGHLVRWIASNGRRLENQEVAYSVMTDSRARFEEKPGSSISHSALRDGAIPRPRLQPARRRDRVRLVDPFEIK